MTVCSDSKYSLVTGNALFCRDNVRFVGTTLQKWQFLSTHKTAHVAHSFDHTLGYRYVLANIFISNRCSRVVGIRICQEIRVNRPVANAMLDFDFFWSFLADFGYFSTFWGHVRSFHWQVRT